MPRQIRVAAVAGPAASRPTELSLGPLSPLLDEPSVTDVLVNGAEQVWVDRGAGLERVPVRFTGEADLRSLAVRLVNSVGGRLDDACPCADAVLPDGVRMHAVLHPLAPGGTALSLRVPRRVPFSLVELVAAGSLPVAVLPWLEAILTARLSFLVSGAGGSGKTTMLTSLLGCISGSERLVVVEDVPEIDPVHPHVVRLTARPANIEGVGAIPLRELVRQALRMRADRLIVGEARGAEVTDLLSALNTGHDGGAATVHANSAGAVPARLEALAAGAGLSRGALHSQLAAGVQAVLHLSRDACGTRRLVEIAVPRRRADGLVVMTVALRVLPFGLRTGPGLADLTRCLAQREVASP
jgi:pilus assembly protein CpaF